MGGIPIREKIPPKSTYLLQKNSLHTIIVSTLQSWFIQKWKKNRWHTSQFQESNLRENIPQIILESKYNVPRKNLGSAYTSLPKFIKGWPDCWVLNRMEVFLHVHHYRTVVRQLHFSRWRFLSIFIARRE